MILKMMILSKMIFYFCGLWILIRQTENEWVYDYT